MTEKKQPRRTMRPRQGKFGKKSNVPTGTVRIDFSFKDRIEDLCRSQRRSIAFPVSEAIDQFTEKYMKTHGDGKRQIDLPDDFEFSDDSWVVRVNKSSLEQLDKLSIIQNRTCADMATIAMHEYFKGETK